MRLLYNSGPEPSFRKIAAASFILHLIIIALAVVPISHRKRDIKSYYVNLVSPTAVRSPKRVADASTKVKARTRRIPPKKNIKASPKAKMSLKSSKVSSMIGHKLKEKQREKEERARRLADIKERIKEEAEYVPEAEEVSEAPDIYAGVGEFDARLLYEAKVFDYIHGFWEKPKIDLEGFVAVFDVRVDREWKIVSYRIVESSGSRLFDRSTLIAMQDAMKSTEFDPLPAPPLDMYDEVINEGMELKFYDEE